MSTIAIKVEYVISEEESKKGVRPKTYHTVLPNGNKEDFEELVGALEMQLDSYKGKEEGKHEGE